MLSMFSFIVIGLDWNARLVETMIDERVTSDNIVSVEVWHYVKMLSAKVMQELRRMERPRRTEI